jgi:hypothetical protein
VPKAGPDKQLCGAQRPNQPKGTTCTLRAGWGTDHPGVGRCRRHGGATASHKDAAKLELAKRECETLGLAIETTPADALLRELWETSANVAYYRARVQQLPNEPTPGEYIPPEEGEKKGHFVPGTPGVYGPTYHVSGIPTGEAKPHILLVLYNQERDRLRQVCEAMLRANVEERRVRMAEADAAQILEAQVRALIAMGLGDRLEEFRRAFVESLGPAGPADIDVPLALTA